MMLACLLYVPFRDPVPAPVMNSDGWHDEAQMFTPPMIATIERLFTSAQRKFYTTTEKRRANVRGRRIG